MAKYFIYPNSNLYLADPVGGDQTSDSNNFAADATSATNETRLTDVSISNPAGMPAQFDTVQFDLTASGNTVLRSIAPLKIQIIQIGMLMIALQPMHLLQGLLALV